MIQVQYAYSEAWPQEGPLRLKGQFAEEISVKPDAARRTANHYLGLEVGMALRASNPILVVGDERPVWRLSVDLHWYGRGKVATLDVVDVDARTDEVVPFSTEKITEIQKLANDIVSRLTPTAEPTI